MGEQTGHPSSWRLFRAHPALGLEELDDDVLAIPAPHELGAAWLALEPAEQRCREADFSAGLQAVARFGSTWEVELAEERAPRVLGVYLDRWKAAGLQRELLDHVWNEARRRDVAATRDSLELRRRQEPGRVLRAHACVWTSRLGRHLKRHPISAVAIAVVASAQIVELLA